jgi:hypothetical protein
MDQVTGQGVVLSRSLSCIRATTALAAVAIAVGGCAAANNTASSQGEQPYKTGYGFSSDAPTTNLYTELFGSSRRDDTNAVQPATATATTQQVQPVAALAANRQTQPAMAAATTRQVQPAPAPTAVVQQPAPPPPPAEPDVPTAYGITANGPTTNLYTELFGPRRRDAQ